MLLSPSAHEVYSPPFPFQAILPLTPAFVRTTGASVKGCSVVKLSALPERPTPVPYAGTITKPVVPLKRP